MADDGEKSFHSVQPETEIIDDDPPPTEGEPLTMPSIAVVEPSATTTTEVTPTTTALSEEPVQNPIAKSNPSKHEPTNELEILSEQFENYLRIAHAFLRTLKRPKDIEICTNLLRNVKTLNSSKQTDVKRNNNIFFRYCLKVLKWTSENQPLEFYQCWNRNMDIGEMEAESRTWLEDNKSYMASKRLKDGTTVIYTAIANDPSAGWQDGGLNILAKLGASQNN